MIRMVDFPDHATDGAEGVRFGRFLRQSAHEIVGVEGVALRMVHDANLVTVELVVVEVNQEDVALLHVGNGEVAVEELHADDVAGTDVKRLHALVAHDEVLQRCVHLHVTHADGNGCREVLVGIGSGTGLHGHQFHSPSAAKEEV